MFRGIICCFLCWLRLLWLWLFKWHASGGFLNCKLKAMRFNQYSNLPREPLACLFCSVTKTVRQTVALAKTDTLRIIIDMCVGEQLSLHVNQTQYKQLLCYMQELYSHALSESLQAIPTHSHRHTHKCYCKLVNIFHTDARPHGAIKH